MDVELLELMSMRLADYDPIRAKQIYNDCHPVWIIKCYYTKQIETFG